MSFLVGPLIMLWLLFSLSVLVAWTRTFTDEGREPPWWLAPGSVVAPPVLALFIVGCAMAMLLLWPFVALENRKKGARP